MEKYEPLNKFFKNTRRHRRFAVDMMDIHITAKTTSEKSAASEDYFVKMLSLGGVLMTADRPHELENKLLMDLTLPENVRISCTGRVTSCLSVKRNRGVRYDIGVQFSDMSEEDKTKLKKFIHWLYLKDAGFAE